MGTRAIKQKVLGLLKQDDLADIETELALLQEKEDAEILTSPD